MTNPYIEELSIRILVVIFLSLAVSGVTAFVVRRRIANESSDHERLAAEMRESAAEIARLRGRLELDAAALDTLSEAVLYLRRNRTVGYVNRAGREMAGVSPGMSLIEAVRDHELENLLRRSVAHGETQSAVIRVMHPEKVVKATAIPVSGAGLVMVLEDQTELRRQQQVKRELVANISHELRTPIATAQLLIETLLNGAADDPDARDAFLTQLHEQVAHLNELVQHSLHLATLEAGRSPRDAAVPVSPSELVETSVRRMLSSAERLHLAIVHEIEPELPLVIVEPEQFRTVFTNLLHNAVKWSPTDGTITVRVRRDAGDVRFEVQDYGQGVSAEALPRLFERFYKGDEARTGSGTGLGLAIAKHIVELYGGRIWAVSEHGQGACFVFTLPAASASST